MKKIIIIIVALVSIAITSCETDNFDAPEVTLSGTVTYNGNAVGVRANATELELWQDDYALKEKIAVYIAQDGTYSARLFNGEYKLVRLEGAPWEDQSSDTITINVSGNTTQDVEVTPYITVDNVTYERIGNAVIAKFTINKIVEEASLSSVKLFVGENYLVDNNINYYAKSIDVSNVTFGEEVTITTTISGDLATDEFFFARVGVLSDKSSEFFYSDVEKLVDTSESMNPVANFSTSISGMEVSFTNTSEYGVSYNWDFGDGTTSTEESPTHTYTTDGEYTVMLNVIGDEGTISSDISYTINVGYTEIAVENGDFSLPGTGRLVDWVNVPGWSSDATTTDSGVEINGWYALDDDYSAVLFTGDVAAYNLTEHVITEGEIFKVNMSGLNIWNGAIINVSLYYDNENGTRNVIQSQTFDEVGGAWTALELIGTAPAGSTGAKVGIEVSNASSDGADGWSGLDDVQLFVK